MGKRLVKRESWGRVNSSVDWRNWGRAPAPHIISLVWEHTPVFLVLGWPRREDPGASWPATLAGLGSSKRGKDPVSKNKKWWHPWSNNLGCPLLFIYIWHSPACVYIQWKDTHDAWEEKRETTDHRKAGHEAAKRIRDGNAFLLVSASVYHLSSHFPQEKSFSLLSVRISRKTQCILD